MYYLSGDRSFDALANTAYLCPYLDPHGDVYVYPHLRDDRVLGLCTCPCPCPFLFPALDPYSGFSPYTVSDSYSSPFYLHHHQKPSHILLPLHHCAHQHFDAGISLGLLVLLLRHTRFARLARYPLLFHHHLDHPLARRLAHLDPEKSLERRSSWLLIGKSRPIFDYGNFIS